MLNELLGENVYEGRGNVDFSNINGGMIPVIFRISHKNHGSLKFETEIRVIECKEENELFLLGERASNCPIKIISTSPEDYDVIIDKVVSTCCSMGILKITHEQYDLGITNKL